MDEFRKRVFLKRFGFLNHPCLCVYDPENIRVKRIDRDALLRCNSTEVENRDVYVIIDGHPLRVCEKERPIDVIYRENKTTIDAIVAVEGDNSVGFEFTIYLPKENVSKLISDLEKRAEREVEREIESC